MAPVSRSRMPAARAIASRWMTEAALRAAAGVLASRHSRRLTLDAVARLAGMSTASLRRYFPTPESLTEAVIDGQVGAKLARLRKRIDVAARSREGGRAALEALVAELLDVFLGGRSQLFRILLHQDAALGASDPVRRSRAAIVELLAGLPGAADSRASARRRELAGDALVGILQGALERSRAEGALTEAARAALRADCVELLAPWLLG